MYLLEKIIWKKRSTHVSFSFMRTPNKKAEPEQQTIRFENNDPATMYFLKAQCAHQKIRSDDYDDDNEKSLNGRWKMDWIKKIECPFIRPEK